MDIQKIEGLLKDIHYPIDKNALLKEAEQKGMQEALPMLQDLPEQKFGSMEDIMSKLPLGKVGGMLSDL